jgi:hypothetical protein
MNFQIDVSSAVTTAPEVSAAAPPTPPDAVDLLRQILDVQREQLTYQRAAAAAHDAAARWRAFLARWQSEFPDLGENCRKVMPQIERSYGRLIAELTERLTEDSDPLDNDFALQDFLDRYGMRLAQLGTILNLVAPLAEAGTPGEAS